MAGRAPTSELARKGATQIVETLRRHGHVAYFAGGCVRDELLGLAPSDYDVATDATPERVRGLFSRSDLVGACFGVALVKLRVDGRTVVVEVATFRADGTYSDSRRPDEVRFSTPEEDARRRDFTVNALFLDPFERGEGPGGRVIDFVGGLADLETRTLRAVGEPSQRLAEDHLRALRAVRLAAKLGFEIEPATARAIAQDAQELRGVSRERVGDELRRMLAHATRGRAVRLLAELGLERPTLLLERGAADGSAGAGLGLRPDRLRPGLVVDALEPGAGPMLALAAWGLDLGVVPAAGHVDQFVRLARRALCLSNEERDEVADALRGLAALGEDGGSRSWGAWREWGMARRKRFAAGAAGRRGLALLRGVDGEAARAWETEVRTLEATPSGLAPAPLVTGDHLVAAGWTPGPMFKRVLDEVYDAQLEGRIATTEQGMELARSLGVYK